MTANISTWLPEGRYVGDGCALRELSYTIGEHSVLLSFFVVNGFRPVSPRTSSVLVCVGVGSYLAYRLYVRFLSPDLFAVLWDKYSGRCVQLSTGWSPRSPLRWRNDRWPHGGEQVDSDSDDDDATSVASCSTTCTRLNDIVELNRDTNRALRPPPPAVRINSAAQRGLASLVEVADRDNPVGLASVLKQQLPSATCASASTAVDDFRCHVIHRTNALLDESDGDADSDGASLVDSPPPIRRHARPKTLLLGGDAPVVSTPQSGGPRSTSCSQSRTDLFWDPLFTPADEVDPLRLGDSDVMRELSTIFAQDFDPAKLSHLFPLDDEQRLRSRDSSIPAMHLFADCHAADLFRRAGVCGSPVGSEFSEMSEVSLAADRLIGETTVQDFDRIHGEIRELKRDVSESLRDFSAWKLARKPHVEDTRRLYCSVVVDEDSSSSEGERRWREQRGHSAGEVAERKGMEKTQSMASSMDDDSCYHTQEPSFEKNDLGGSLASSMAYSCEFRHAFDDDVSAKVAPIAASYRSIDSACVSAAASSDLTPVSGSGGESDTQMTVSGVASPQSPQVVETTGRCERKLLPTLREEDASRALSLSPKSPRRGSPLEGVPIRRAASSSTPSCSPKSTGDCRMTEKRDLLCVQRSRLDSLSSSLMSASAVSLEWEEEGIDERTNLVTDDASTTFGCLSDGGDDVQGEYCGTETDESITNGEVQLCWHDSLKVTPLRFDAVCGFDFDTFSHAYFSHDAKIEKLMRQLRKTTEYRSVLVFPSAYHSATIEAILFSVWSGGASVFRCKSFSIVQQALELSYRRCHLLSQWRFAPSCRFLSPTKATEQLAKLTSCLRYLWDLNEQATCSNQTGRTRFDGVQRAAINRCYLLEGVRLLMLLRAIDAFEYTIFTRQSPQPFYDEYFRTYSPDSLVARICSLFWSQPLDELELGLFADAVGARVELYRFLSSTPHIVSVFNEQKSTPMPTVSLVQLDATFESVGLLRASS